MNEDLIHEMMLVLQNIREAANAGTDIDLDEIDLVIDAAAAAGYDLAD